MIGKSIENTHRLSDPVLLKPQMSNECSIAGSRSLQVDSAQVDPDRTIDAAITRTVLQVLFAF